MRDDLKRNSNEKNDFDKILCIPCIQTLNQNIGFSKCISKTIVNYGGIINVSKQFILLTINVNIFTLILKAQGSI